MTTRWCKVCDGWHDLDRSWPHNCLPEAPQRSDLPAPHIVGDTMDGIQSQLDGKIYDSKAALRRSYRAGGVIEVGNDPARLRPRVRPKSDEKAIRDSIVKAVARVERGDVRPHMKDKL